ncbi:unnamed protein product [Acanthoscelides obtectus]|uniref:RNA polymerase II-associated protein 3 n=1 Tax=Acanthoscelides obtectus TaxID=200917 RepID=A0A9P0PI70_ACAOB|nr:unnamed protein product [Acanthoscelides obtectus]CAK1650839.1 RNA polymerase II-associated protein 3 [Acanthoscelides obtectus]
MDPVLLQKILKENNAVLQEYSEDLKNWGEDMKRKDESLRGVKTESPSTRDKKVETEEKNENKVKKKSLAKSTRRVGSTDYSAWEKFDVDAELERLDYDKDEDSELTDEHNEGMYDEAIVEKDKGNKFVKSQKWDEAIKCYTKAIKCYSFDPIFYANRALCHLKKEDFEKCEKDCSLSLKLDPTYVKAYQRRAAAKIGLKQYEFAESDLIKVLELEPKNGESKSELLKLRQKLDKPEKPEQRPVSKFTISRKKVSTSNKLFSPLVSPITTKPEPNISKAVDDSKDISIWPEDDVIIVKPVNKPPHIRSQKPLKRVKIIEIDSSQPKIKNIGSPESSKKKETVAIKEHVVAKQEAGTEATLILNVPSSMEATYKSEFKKNQAEKNDKLKVFYKGEKCESLFKKKQENDETNEKSKTNTTSNILETENNLKQIQNSSNVDKKTISNISNIDFTPPKSSVQFNLTWKNIMDMHIKYKYLKSIDPILLPKIFQNSLESNVFSNILEVLSRYFTANNDNVWDILESMTHVKRFSALAMFMTSQDKQNLWRLIDYIKENDNEHKADVDNLIQKYEL